MSSRASIVLVTALTMLCVAALATAAEDPMAPYYGNTLHQKRSNGTEAWYTFKPDHTYGALNQDGTTYAGTWRINEQGETCIKIPNRATDPCAKFQARHVGDTWDRQMPNGGSEHFILEAGLKPPPAGGKAKEGPG